MMLRAPETEALYEGNAQKGFGIPILDGSLLPLVLTAAHEAIGMSKTLWGRWRSPDATGLKTLWIRKQSNTKQINISNNQQPSGDKRFTYIITIDQVFLRPAFLLPNFINGCPQF
jgi:hypothetical protein